MKKRYIIIALSCLIASASAQAQGVKIHYTDGTVTDIPYDKLDYIEAYEGTPEGLEAVDLGLPSGTKWANMNVGATKPEEFGDYFQWGETVSCNDTTEDLAWNSNYAPGGIEFTGSTYKDCGTEVDPMFADGSLTLNGETWQCSISGNPKYDAATAVWGASWRMPTREQQDELRDSCDWEEVTVNGVVGSKVTSRTNGNSIFLPAAGLRYGKKFQNVGSFGSYWSSDIYETFADGAYAVNFIAGYVYRSYSGRNRGFSVRAVAAAE